MALAYRGFFALMRNPRVTSYNLNTSAVFVFAGVLMDLLSREKPDAIGVAFDTSEPTHRHKVYPEYKKTREKMPEELAASLPYIDRLCDAFGIPVLRYPGWEADDVIGTLASAAAGEGYETIMVTPDKDFAQIVSKHVSIARPAKGGGFDMLDERAVCEEWGVERPEQTIDILALMGDSSDNIPGVPGIGKKTAQKLIATYGSVENLYEHVDDLSGKQRENVAENRELAFLSKRLVTIVTDVPLEHSASTLHYGGENRELLGELFGELEFKTLHKRFFGDSMTVQTREDFATISGTEHEYRLIRTEQEATALVELLEKQESVCFDLETTGLDEKRAELSLIHI